MSSKKAKRKKSKNTMENAPSLLKEILKDIFIAHWFVSSLILIMVVSAMTLARTSHQKRTAVAEWQTLREENQKLQIEWQSLRLEMSSLTESDRISRMARKQLDMIKVNTENEKIISL